MKKYKIVEDLKVYDKGVAKGDRRFTLEPDTSLNLDVVYIIFKQGEIYEGADRTELGNWLIENNLVEEI